MDKQTVDTLMNNLRSIREATPSEMGEWLDDAQAIILDRFGDLSIEQRATLIVQLAGHMSMINGLGRVEEAVHALISTVETLKD